MQIKPERLTYQQFMPKDSSLKMFRFQISQTTGLHWHEFYELCFIISGQGVHLLNGKQSSVQRGSLFLLTPADFHELMPEQGQSLKLFNTIFSEEMLDSTIIEMLSHYNEMQVSLIEDKAISNLEYEFERLWSEIHTDQLAQRRMIKYTLERIIVDLLRYALLPFDQKATQIDLIPPIRKALIFMQHHFREDLSLKDVAIQASLTPNYFSESFKKSVGISFQAYLQDLRISFAKSLLKASSLSITEICYASGFNNQSHFAKVFKQKVSLSPKEFRKTQIIETND